MHDRYNIILNHFSEFQKLQSYWHNQRHVQIHIAFPVVLSSHAYFLGEQNNSKNQTRSKLMRLRLYHLFETILDLMKIGIELIESETIQIAILTTHAFFALSARVLLSGWVIVKYRSTAIVPSANIELKVD